MADFLAVGVYPGVVYLLQQAFPKHQILKEVTLVIQEANL